jgi:nucleoside-diphosphate-sugar epimerase
VWQGFIGSHIAEQLVKKYDVIGIDCFTDYYSVKIKERNLSNLLRNKNFQFLKADLQTSDLKELDVKYVFHEAGQPGVRASWGNHFEVYLKDNILVTQKLLEHFSNSDIEKFVYASSSSIYGDAKKFPITEETMPQPISPYGVSKLAGENLCSLYHKNYRLPMVILRYFTVFGPRQRPDMGINKFIRSVLNEEEITIYGDGNQTRDFTYVSDIVNANISAASSNVDGEIFNIAGGSRISVLDLIAKIEAITGKKANKVFVEPQKGDVTDTWASIRKAKILLRYIPQFEFDEGLKKQIEWQIENGI